MNYPEAIKFTLRGALVFLASFDSLYANDELIKRVDPTEQGWAILREYSAAEREKVCKKYNGKYLGYYGKVFFIEKCQRREVDWQALPLKVQMEREVLMVDGEVIGALRKGRPLEQHGQVGDRGCEQLENKYVTSSYTDIFLVSDCRLRLFPDWETFDTHRRTRVQDERVILALSNQEFNRLRRGRQMPSVIDARYRDVLSGRAGVDLIPIDEACEGLNGRDVSYYSRIYRIENCRKREWDASRFKIDRRGQTVLQEMSSEQWLALPDGEPMSAKNSH